MKARIPPMVSSRRIPKPGKMNHVEQVAGYYQHNYGAPVLRCMARCWWCEKIKAVMHEPEWVPPARLPFRSVVLYVIMRRALFRKGWTARAGSLHCPECSL